MKESKFQSSVIKEIKERFPGCKVLKNDPNYIQGFPDLTILYKNNWGVLECKKSDREPYQMNQEFYISELKDMSFASMICPQNREAVMNELQQALQPSRATCISGSQ